MTATGAGALPTERQSSLVVNGSFEEGPAVGRFLNLASGDTSVRGWVVTGEGVEIRIQK